MREFPQKLRGGEVVEPGCTSIGIGIETPGYSQTSLFGSTTYASCTADLSLLVRNNKESNLSGKYLQESPKVYCWREATLEFLWGKEVL